MGTGKLRRVLYIHRHDHRSWSMIYSRSCISHHASISIICYLPYISCIVHHRSDHTSFALLSWHIASILTSFFFLVSVSTPLWWCYLYMWKNQGGHPHDFYVAHRSARITDATQYYERDTANIKVRKRFFPLLISKVVWILLYLVFRVVYCLCLMLVLFYHQRCHENVCKLVM